MERPIYYRDGQDCRGGCLSRSYYKTLYCYLQCRYNAAMTAKKLFIHRSTFLNRLERISELIQADLEDFRSRLYLSASYYILEEEKQ